MNSIIRRAAAAGTTALALGGGVALGASGAASAATTSASHAPAIGAPASQSGSARTHCGINQVRDWLRYTGSNQRGIFYHIEFRNPEGFSCAVHGTPTVEALNSRHQVIGSPARYHGFPGTDATRIPAFGTDHSTIEAVSPSYFRDSHPVRASYLRIWLPGDSYSETVPFSHPVTSRGPSNLYVGSVKTGS